MVASGVVGGDELFEGDHHVVVIFRFGTLLININAMLINRFIDLINTCLMSCSLIQSSVSLLWCELSYKCFIQSNPVVKIWRFREI
jgi:hypothetical protein